MHLRWRPEGPGRNFHDKGWFGVESDKPGEVSGLARSGSNPVGDLKLKHHYAEPGRTPVCKDPFQDGGGDIIREISGNLVSWPHLILKRVTQDIGLDNFESGVTLKPLGQDPNHAGVNFDGDNPAPGPEEGFGQGAEPGPDFEDDVIRPELAGPQDRLSDPLIYEKVLAQGFPGKEPVSGEQVEGFGPERRRGTLPVKNWWPCTHR